MEWIQIRSIQMSSNKKTISSTKFPQLQPPNYGLDRSNSLLTTPALVPPSGTGAHIITAHTIITTPGLISLFARLITSIFMPQPQVRSSILDYSLPKGISQLSIMVGVFILATRIKVNSKWRSEIMSTRVILSESLAQPDEHWGPTCIGKSG